MYSVWLFAVYLLLAMCSALTAAVSQLRFVAMHGKRRSGNSSSDKSMAGNSVSRDDRSNIVESLLQLVAGLVVPKRWFSHFYAIGVVWNALNIVSAAVSSGVGDANHLCLLMLEVHLLRRLVECSTITAFGNSTMHISGYLVGLVHYFLAPLCFSLQQQETAETASSSVVARVFALLVFTAASMLQYQSHYHLFDLKTKAKALPPAQKYSLPTKGLFRWVACPHYFTEILIYISLCMASVWPNWAAMGLVVWVTSNLAVVALEQMRWYKETFSELPEGWKSLIPFVY